jgi:sporulation protein YlmC with PRC-barrel domain
MDKAPARRMKTLCRLEGMPIRTKAGKRLGHVWDLRGTWSPGRAPVIDEIVYGSGGLLEKLGFKRRKLDCIPWQYVIAVGEQEIIVTDSAT